MISPRLSTAEAAALLTELLHQEISETRLKYWRSVRRGPPVEYFCGRPGYLESGLRDYAAKAFQPQSTERRSYHRRSERGEAAAP